MTPTLTEAQRYVADRHAFRREQIILPDGRTLGEAEEPWQTEFIYGPLDELDASGQWLYRVLDYELPRGHAKTTMDAAEAITVAVMERDWRIYIAAADQEQAGIAFEILTGMVKRNPRLARSFKLGKSEARVAATGSVIRVLSSDALTTYGLGGVGRGYLAIVDELWAHRSRELFDALYTATGKTRDWRVIITTNAGFDTQSVAWEIRELCRTMGPPFYLYSPDGSVAGWLTDEWREMQRRSLPPDVYQRLIENKWVEGSGSFITRAQLEQCIDQDWRPQLAGSPDQSYVVGIDLGLKHDRTALVVGHLDRAANTVVLDHLKVWQGSKTQPVNIGDVEAELLGVADRFRLRRAVLDPWQLQSTLQRLRGRLPVHEFTFTAESVRKLSENLFTLLQGGRLRLFHDEALERELLALNVVQKSYGWRIDHQAGGYSDRAMALGMMALEAVQGGGGSPNLRFLPAPGESIDDLEAGWTMVF